MTLALCAFRFKCCLIILVCGGVCEGVFKQVDPCLWKLLSDFQGRFYGSKWVSLPDRHFGSKCEFSCWKIVISWTGESSKITPRHFPRKLQAGSGRAPSDPGPPCWERQNLKERGEVLEALEAARALREAAHHDHGAVGGAQPRERLALLGVGVGVQFVCILCARLSSRSLAQRLMVLGLLLMGLMRV